MKKRIYLSAPHLTGEELEYLQDALASNWIAPVGPHVDAFEKELGDHLKIQHVVLTNSGTSAIHLGLLALGVAPGDEVICSSLTFCASANPIVYCGARPVFVDSEASTWNMDPVLLAQAVEDRIKKTGKKPKAIIVVHLYGMPADMDPIIRVSAQYEIPVLEDAAEALGSTYRRQALGTLGAAGVLSFNGNKIITASGGGALITSNGNLAARARYLRQEAREPVPYYEHQETGYNYRFSNILAALGRSQFKALSERIDKRRYIFDFYRRRLPQGLVRFQEEKNPCFTNRWLTVIQMLHPDVAPEKLRLALEAEQIESRPVWKPMHLQPVFRDCPSYINGTSEDLFNRGLCLPSGTAMTDNDLGRITEIISHQLSNSD